MQPQQKVVLIADDDASVRDAAKAYLEHKGYAVIVAEDGVRAMKYLSLQPVDAVLIDILMPHQDGLETILGIKRLYPKTRIFAMTGGGVKLKTLDLLQIATKFGAEGVLQKPFAPQDLLVVLESPAPAKEKIAS